MSDSNIQRIQLVVTCPNCGSPDYEIDLDCKDLYSHVSTPCEECDKDIDVSVSVLLQSTEGSDG